MAACVLGVISASSCSKEEFFGLENSEYLDNSLKTEIAMSQEFADYSIACYNLMQEMSQSVDTTDMQIQGIVNGKPIYFKTGSDESLKNLYEGLIKAYPEMTKADKLDIEEIQEIALSKNKALKGLAKSTKYNYYRQSESWILSASGGWTDWIYIDGDWTFESHWMSYSAVSNALLYCGENSFGMNGGGLVFGDDSGVSMIGYGEYWPYMRRYGGPTPEANFLVAPNANIYNLEIWDIAYALGPGFYQDCRVHYIFNEEMEYMVYYY